MLRALWFLLKVSALLGGVIWLLERPGHISVTWQGYLIETSIGFALVCLLGFLFVYTIFYRFWRAIVSVPEVYRRYKTIQQREKGYRDVTAGLVAIAAGDNRAAEKYARRAAALIPDAPLARLLTAQQYLLSGQVVKARRVFVDLLDDDDASFLGLRGLLSDTLRAGDYQEALQYIRQADKLQPKRAWVVRTLFDLETRNQEWTRAEKALQKAERLGLFDRAAATRHRQALFLAQADAATKIGDTKKALSWASHAFSCDPAFGPAAVKWAELLNSSGKRKAAIKVVERAWVANPSPDLGRLWMMFVPTARKMLSPYDVGKEGYLWAKKLSDLKPEHRDSLRLAGAAALTGKYWREARAYLLKAQDYRMLSKLEQSETGNQAKAREWLEMANDDQPESRWICAECGFTAAEWAPLCPHCGVFNASHWAVPSADMRQVSVQNIRVPDGDILTPPVARSL